MPRTGRGSKPGSNKQGQKGEPGVVIADIRPIDGSGSNELYEDWGATNQTLLRLAEANFADGIGELSEDLPNPREISNAVSQQDGDEPSSAGLSDLFWAWGQFIDHDIDLTEAGETEFYPIEVPTGDPFFDPDGTGDAIIPFTRVDPVDGTGETLAREYPNQITSFLDASMIYGSDEETAASLRDESGRLLLDEQGVVIQTGGGSVLAGDVRAGENVALTSLHSLFAREHNRIVDELAAQDPSLTGDELYAAARQRVEAEVQAITFNEFLPVLVGKDAIERYEGYDPDVNPGISVEFSTAAFRFGHSLLSSEIQRLDEDGTVIDAGNIALADAFFSPEEITENGGIEPILRGLADGTAQELDTQVVEDVRSFLFGTPDSGGLDLASINIQRGRDLGVPFYNDLREAVGLERVEDFSEITSDPELAAQLEELYGDVDTVDAWIGGLAEDPANGGVVGETFGAVITDQFVRIRDGDPYWSQGSDLPQSEIKELWDTTLADVIEANTEIDSIQDNALFAYDRISGTEGGETLEGGDDRDLLLGLAGDDTINGGAGADQIEGGEGNDTLNGDAGRDIVEGGAGDDVLTGGRDRDEFVFSSKFGNDTITDFTAGKGGDKLTFDSELFGGTKQVLELAVQQGDDVFIDLGEEGSVLLEDVDLASLQRDDMVIA